MTQLLQGMTSNFTFLHLLNIDMILVSTKTGWPFYPWLLYAESTVKFLKAVQFNNTEVFGSTGSVGDGHFYHYFRKSVTLDFFNVKFQFGDCRPLFLKIRYFRKPLYVLQNCRKSSCKFLGYNPAKEALLIGDLGADLVYSYSVKKTTVRIIGRGSGSDWGQFNDPAGIITDDFGNVIVADSKNHRCQMFAKNRNFSAKLDFDRKIRRPSAVAVDHCDGNVFIYVLSLWDRGYLTKFRMCQM